MSVTLHCQGFEIELHEDEKFNKVRHRLNKAFKTVEDVRNGEWDAEKAKNSSNKEGIPQPYHDLTFYVVNEDEDEDEQPGRISINPEKIIAVSSDEYSDQPASDSGEEEEEEQEEEEEED